MPTVALAPTAGVLYQAFTNGGLPLTAGLIYTYGAGGTTPKATYTTSAGNVQNANPIVLEASGRPPSEVWLIATDSYRFDVCDSLGNLIKTYDNVPGLSGAASLAASSGSSLIGFIQSGAGAVAETVQTKLREIVSVKDFGAVGDGATDDTAAFAAAVLAHRSVWMPVGTFKITGNVTFAQVGQQLLGAGIGVTTVTVDHASNPGIVWNTGTANLEVGNFTLTRSINATSGGTGIKASGVIGTSRIHDMLVEKHYLGMELGSTDFSYAERVTVQKCNSHGISLTNDASNSAVQWDIRDSLSQMNSGDGARFTSTAGPAQVTLGQWTNFTTFANSGHGLAVIGLVGVPAHDLRMSDCFLGSDGESEIYLDTYGRQHVIKNSFTEIAGTLATGPTLTTPASDIGRGVQITANNVQVSISNHTSSGNSEEGLVTSGTQTQISGGTFINNGANGTAGSAFGVHSITGRTMINGIRAGNVSGATSQLYGVVIVADTVILTNSDLTGNATGPVSYSSVFPPAGSVVWGNFPVSMVNYMPQSTSMQAGMGVGAPVGGIGAAGTVNVATSVALNGVAYTNP